MLMKLDNRHLQRLVLPSRYYFFFFHVSRFRLSYPPASGHYCQQRKSEEESYLWLVTKEKEEMGFEAFLFSGCGWMSMSSNPGGVCAA